MMFRVAVANPTFAELRRDYKKPTVLPLRMAGWIVELCRVTGEMSSEV